MDGPEAHLLADTIHFAVVDTMKHIVIVSLRTHCQPTHCRIIWNWRLRNWLDYDPKLVRTKYDVCLVKEVDVEASLDSGIYIVIIASHVHPLFGIFS